jgi:hypothetical protein
MLRTIIKRGSKKRDEQRSYRVTLDERSQDRLMRLKRRLRGKNDRELIALGLEALDQRTDMVIKKLALKRIRSFERQGRTPEQIADELNRRKLPVFGDAENWQEEAVLELLDKENKRSVQSRPRIRGKKLVWE